MRKRFLCLMLVLMLLGTALPVLGAYENTHTNTGDQRADIVAVALTQVGYREGYNNDTKYGDWYGLPNHPWCGMFVSWCANQAGVPISVIKKAAIANPSYFGFTTYFTSAQRGPQPGDLFFKKSFTHMGLVVRVEGDYFYTVEGNTNTNYSNDGIGVFTQRRKLSDYVFVSPAYTTDAGHNYVKGYEAQHPHKEYYSCSHCSGFYYTGNTGTSQSCTTCVQAACTHQYGSWTTAGSSHKRTCALCAKEETGKHSWGSGTVLTQATCGSAGSLRHSCTLCGFEETASVPATGKHIWGSWSQSAQGHSHTCGACGKQETLEHTMPEVWEINETAHKRQCTTCQYLREEAHTYPEGCETACRDCGYLPENGHDIGWQFDENTHWAICARCGQETQRGSHAYTNDCDGLCDDCGFTRQVTHVYEESYEADNFGHWQMCIRCREKTESQTHLPGPEATEEQAQTCSICGHELMARLAHIHRYEPMEHDGTAHWGTCACGQVLERALHSWTPEGVCSACGVPADAVGGQDWEALLWLLIPAGCIILAMVLVVTRPRKKKSVQNASHTEMSVRE